MWLCSQSTVTFCLETVPELISSLLKFELLKMLNITSEEDMSNWKSFISVIEKIRSFQLFPIWKIET